MSDLRVCSKCDVERPLTDYWRHPKSKQGRCARCKFCQAAEHKAWQQKNREYVLEYQRDRDFERKFGISTEIYEHMLNEQKHVCAICGQKETAKRNGRVMALAVDHCHTTQKVRGLLCTNCNQGLGRFRDNPQSLIAAAAYLENAT